jgi:hypothetical protein
MIVAALLFVLGLVVFVIELRRAPGLRARRQQPSKT